jgi:hypothetical protein
MKQNIKERPIIFSGEMVKAILDGKKTMARRVIKSDIGAYDHGHIIKQSSDKSREGSACFFNKPVGCMVTSSKLVKCPYGKIGDRLWVRETWAPVNSCGESALAYKADNEIICLSENEEFLDEYGTLNYTDPRLAKYAFADWADDLVNGVEGAWKSPITMPRWASRILLEITDIRVERLQDISETDAKKEGMPPSHPSIDKISMQHGFNSFSQSCFAQSWDSLYDENSPKRWANNQWVWVIEFKVIKSC